MLLLQLLLLLLTPITGVTYQSDGRIMVRLSRAQGTKIIRQFHRSMAVHHIDLSLHGIFKTQTKLFLSILPPCLFI